MYKLTLPPNKSDHILGQLTSKVVLVEYGDYECPHSVKANLWIKKLLDEFRGDLSYIYRHYPLNLLHPNSALAATAVEAAGVKNRFWEMHELLFTRRDMLSLDGILTMAEQLGLNIEEFIYNLDREDLMDRVSRDLMTGEDSGVISTPAFFMNSIKMEGPISYEIIRENIMKILEGQNLSA